MGLNYDGFRRVFIRAGQQFDQDSTGFRCVYESLTPEERGELRDWLESVRAVGEKCPFGWCLRVKVEHDDFDDNGDKVGETNVEFTAHTMLTAIKCWDEGEPFAPDTVRP